jgi:cation diffusion facilitator CzcD-associated flavoprotein CzcO
MGQAGLSAAYHLMRRGYEPGERMLLLDANAGPGGAWQHRWPSLTLKTANGVADLPGWGLREAIDVDDEVPAASTVARYYAAYEERFRLGVLRPVTVDRVEQPDGTGTEFVLTLSGDGRPGAAEGRPADTVRARAIVNATGTWDRPRIPYYPGIATFEGRQLHTRDYSRAEDLAGSHVLVVGAGISAVQHLGELAQVTRTSWVSRSRPDIRDAEFTPEVGADVVARVAERVRQGLPPGSVVSNTGLPIAAVSSEALPRCRPMFDRIDRTGVVWDPDVPRAWGAVPEGGRLDVDVILWATGFIHRLDHLAPLDLRTPEGGLLVDGRATTRAVENHGVHLPGYGPSASTIGANRAGRAIARELDEYLAARAGPGSQCHSPHSAVFSRRT